MTTAPDVVVGGTIAALVAADALAAAGRRVDLFLPARGIGGGFLPLERDGRRLDLGPRLIELGYDDDTPADVPPPLADYQPGPHGHRPYLRLVDGLVMGLVGDDLGEVAPAACSVGGRRTSDYALAGDLSGLGDALDDATLDTLAQAADRARRAEGDHGWFSPERGGLPWDRSYAEVGRAHTGAPFHDLLIEPIVAKILPGGAAEVLAPLHRKIWLPLFHPVTAWEACAGTLTYRPTRPLLSVGGGGMGEVVRRLVERIEASPAIGIHREGRLTRIEPVDGATSLGFESEVVVRADRPILGVGPDDLFAATAVPYVVDKVQSSMVWFDLPDDSVGDLPSVLFSAEPELAVMRVTESQADTVVGARTVCVEVRPDVADAAAAALEGLAALGVVRSTAPARMVTSASVPAFAVPSAANRQRFQTARVAYDRCGVRAQVVGGATAFAVDSFNEQVIQGLAAVDARTS